MTEQSGLDPRYPLAETQKEQIRARTGRPLLDTTMEAVRAGRLQPEDLTIHPETLRKQARVAELAGYVQLAANLRRAAELAEIPNDRLLVMYEALRPRRSSYSGLLALASELEDLYGARETADLVRQAADAYRSAGLLQAGRE